MLQYLTLSLVPFATMRKSVSKKTDPDVFIKSARQLQAIFKSVPDGITVENKKGTVVYANDAAAKIFGYSEGSDIVGKRITKLFNRFVLQDRKGNEISLDRLPAARALRNKRDVVMVMKLTHKKTDEERWIVAKATVVEAEEGEAHLAVKLLQDISEEIEEQKRREIFVSLVSHEIKNPLTSIKAFAQLLKKRILNGEAEESVDFVDNIDGQIEKLIKIINDLMDISRIRRGLLKLELKPTDIDTLVDSIVENFEPTALERKVIRKGRIDTYVHVDEIRIGQVLLNLLTNAKKYSPSGTKIVIQVKKKKDMVVVSVTDQGVGIPKERMKDIFRLYSRLENDKLKSQPTGLGLGLYISSAIVKSHKGKIWVKSKEGRGSTFFFSLPIDQG